MLASTAAGAGVTLAVMGPAPRPQPALTTASIPATRSTPSTYEPASLVTTPMPPIEKPRSIALTPAQVRSWRYQLQNIEPAQIARSAADLVVVDYASSQGPFSSAQVDEMQRKPDGSRRLVLAYLSVGEAESYRYYWSRDWQARPPVWLGAENPNWRGNYAVQFWDPTWQAIVFDFADRIVRAGFDGVYLDRVDAFETVGRSSAMVDFVARISARVKAARPGFMVVSQNGDALIPDRRFRDAIDAFAREDLFYGEGKDGQRNKPEAIRESLRRLKMLAADSKPVLVVEYPRDEAQSEAIAREIAAQGFIGLTARRELDQP